MAHRVLIPSSSAGTGWQNPANALTENAQAAVFPAGAGAPHWLRLTGLSNRVLPDGDQPTGFIVEVGALGTGGPDAQAGAFGLASLTYQASVGDLADEAPQTCDGDGGTYFGYALPITGDFASLTVVHDAGEPIDVGRIVATFYLGSGAIVSYGLHYSHDGVAWTAVPGTIPQYTTSGTKFFTEDVGGLSIAARYFRVTLRDSVGPGVPSMARLYEFTLYGEDEITAIAAPGSSDATERLQFAFTKDGASPVGDIGTFEVPADGGAFVFGSPSSTFGADVTAADIAASTFGLLIRRADGFGDEAVSTDRRIDYARITVYHTQTGGSFLSDRIAGLQLNIIGKEDPSGTAANPSIRLKQATLKFQPQVEGEDVYSQGDLLPTDYVIHTEMSEVTLEGKLTYDEIRYHLAANLGKPVTSLLAPGVYRDEFFLNARGQTDKQSYTVEYGDANNAERVVGAILTELGFGTNRKEVTLSGKGFAGKVNGQAGLTAGANAVQTVTVAGTPTGGNYRLRFKGADTADIAYNANAAAIQTALQALSTIGAGNATVTGAGPYTVTFAADLAGEPQPLIEMGKNGLTGGADPKIVTAITTLGGYTELPGIPVLGGEFSVYFADTRADLAANKLGKLYRIDVSTGNRFAPSWVIDDAKESYDMAGEEAKQTLAATFKVQADTAAEALVTAARARANKYMRIEAVGPVISGGHKFRITVDLHCRVKMIRPFSEEGIVYAREFEAGARFDPTWGQACQVSVIHDRPTF